MRVPPTPSQRNPLRYRCAQIAFLLLIVYGWIPTFFGAAQEIMGTPPAAPQESQHPDFRGQKITCLTNQPHARTFEVLAKWFHEETGAAVHYVVVSSPDLLNAAVTDMDSQRPEFDVFMIRYQHLGFLVEHEMLVDLTAFIEQNRALLKPEDFIPSLYDNYTLYAGKRWALPLDGDTHVLFYRKSLLRKYGFNPPDTWDEYLQIARTITLNEGHNGIYGTVIMMHPFMMRSVSSFLNRLGAFGGQLFDDSGVPTVNSPEAVEALQTLVDACPYALPTPVETDWVASREAFLMGRAAMAEQWTDVGIMAQDPAQSMVRDDWGVVRLPKGRGEKARHAAPLNAGFCLAISSKAPHSELARAFVLFAIRPDTNFRLNLSNVGVDPTRLSVLRSEEYRQFAPEVSAAVESAMQEATPWPKIPEATHLMEILAENLVLAVEGRQWPRQALDDTQRRWLEVLRRK